ncbi:thioredoxin [Stylonychia lemnae]|uniref:Thioredoxin n=1 Tax=Stylonychia lemnae TaxID=5949 RepID=A0A078AST1_STYLE|nr:thioredoxin [Stylonychia lemnae]|eukprot:CDW83883.1 thioredoxin [Stylonychia lemnae]
MTIPRIIQNNSMMTHRISLMQFSKSFFGSDSNIKKPEYIKEMTSMEDWNSILDSKTPVVFQCSASWCRPCQVLRPVAEKIIKDHNGRVVFYYVDIEKFPEISNMLNIQHVPQLYSVKDGQLVNSLSGVPNNTDLNKFVADLYDPNEPQVKE